MTNPLKLRIGVVSERRSLEELQVRASLNNPGDRMALIANPDAIDLPAAQILVGQVFVAEREGVVVGFASVLDRPDGNAELDGLFVDPVHWRGGVGRALVDRCATYGRKLNAKAIHVVGNPHALEFYLACGFFQIGTEQTRFGEGILMRKAL